MSGDKILRIAISQLGITESPPDSNDVKYNTWYYGKEVSGSAYPWCMTFVQWCYNQVGIPLPYKTASCGDLLSWYKKNEPDCIVDKPIQGCIVIFDLPNTKYTTDHTGIFESMGSKYITTIDGNTGTSNDANGGAVMRRSRPNDYIKAFIVPRSIRGETCMTELPILAYGDNGEAVKALQTILNLRGSCNLVIDGSFGPQTRKCVKQLQTERNLSVDGSVGPETWSNLISW